MDVIVLGIGTCGGDLSLRLLSSGLDVVGTISFNCGAAPHTISISAFKNIGASTTLNGGGKIKLLGQGIQRLFVVESWATLTLCNIVLTNGYLLGDGGAIHSNGTLVLVNSSIRNSRAAGSGGAIVNYGPLTVTGWRLENNQALNGGALYQRCTICTNTVIWSRNGG